MAGKYKESEDLAKHLLEKHGYCVLRNGWPDFFCLRDGEFLAVEVKTGSHKLSKDQRKMHEMLQMAGIKTVVIRNSELVPAFLKGILPWT